MYKGILSNHLNFDYNVHSFIYFTGNINKYI